MQRVVCPPLVPKTLAITSIVTCVTSECWSAAQLPKMGLLVDAVGLGRELVGVQQDTGKELRVA